MRLLIALLFALPLSLPATAKDVNIGSASVTLTTPKDYCEFDGANAADAGMIKAVEALLDGNRLLGISANCKQLADWRGGKRALLEDFAQYQTLASMADAASPPAPEQTIKEICANMRAEGEKAVVGMASDMKTRIEQTLKEVKLNQIRFLGVVGEEPGVCYAVLVQRFKAYNGKDVTQVALYATTFVKGKIVYYYLFAPYQSNFTVPTLLARHKANVAALLAANKN